MLQLLPEKLASFLLPVSSPQRNSPSGPWMTIVVSRPVLLTFRLSLGTAWVKVMRWSGLESPKPRHLLPERSMLPVIAGIETLPPVEPPTDAVFFVASRVKPSKFAVTSAMATVALTMLLVITRVVAIAMERIKDAM